MAISTLPPLISYDIAWNASPLQVSPPPLFTSISKRAMRPWQALPASRQYELDRNEAGTWRPGLDNRDGALDPNNAASPYATSATAPYVLPGRPCRVRATLAVNLLTLDQATAGEGTGQRPGVVPPQMRVSADAGNTLTLAASGSAYQGSQIYQCVVPNGTASGSGVLAVASVPVVPGAWYSFQAQMQVASSLSFSVVPVVIWYDNLGNQVGTATWLQSALVAGAGTWAQVPASWLAPAGAYSATVKIATASTATASTTLLLDGLQWEASATPTAWQQPGALSANMLPREIATGTQSIDPVTDSASSWFYTTAGTVARATNLSTAPSGQGAAVAWTTPVGSGSAARLYCGVVPSAAPSSAVEGAVQDIVQVIASTQYTASVYLSRAISADATVQVTVSWRWFDINGNLLSTSSGAAVTVPTSGWIRGTCTASAPATAVWGRVRIFISSPASTTAQNVIYATGWQVEAAAAASTWTDPGVIKYFFSGFVDQLPQRWELSGTWTRSDLLAVDGLGEIGSDQLQDPFIEECLALAPDFLYLLNDPAGASVVTDVAGQCPAGVVTNSPYGGGSLTLGAAISGTTVFTGTQGPVAAFANTPSNAQQTGLTYINLPAQMTVPGYGSTLPAQVPAFTRILAFCATSAPVGSAMHLWSAMAAVTTFSGNLAGIDIYIDTSGHLNIGAGSSLMDVVNYPTNYCDGNWHLVSVGMNSGPGGYTMTTSVDGVSNSFTSPYQMPYGIATDAIGCFTRVGGEINGGANASIAMAGQFPVNLSAAQITNLYNSWRTGSAGESTGARFARVLSWIGWTGPTSIDSGSTQQMGGAQDLSGSSGNDALASIALTENGDSYASKSGVMTFKGRSARYNRNTPQFVFGERGQWGEWPYEDVELPLDQVHTYTDVQVSQYASYSQYSFYNPQQQTATSASVAGEALFFDRVLQRTINVQNFSEVQDAATYLRGQYQQPLTRAKGIRLHPSAVPGLYAVCLSLGKGTRIRVMRRPNAWAPPIQFDGFVERVQWDVAPSGDAWVTVECSPATRASYWVLSALYTTLNAQGASGQNTARINGLPDSAYNALASSLPQGYQLTFDPGTAVAETMTIAPGGIPATTIGYSTATLTFTTNFAFTHSAGAVVCEPLPTGYTNPATWDSFSVLGAGSAQLQSSAASGTNQLTIGPWPDGAANPLTADLSLGDLLWVGVGTPNFEGYNLLHPNAATAGEGAIPLAAGTDGNTVGVSSAYAGTVPATASATAYQGANVWQASVSANAAATNRLIRVVKAAATPLVAFTWSVYVRSATTGANPSVHGEIQWLDSTGTVIATVTGASVVLTGSPSAAWTRITVSGTAPAGCVWACPSVRLEATTPASAWTFQADGLQWEAAAGASVFQVCPQVFSVAAAAPGYSTVVVTLAANLANSHNPNETVCDPLPPGTTSVSALSPTARLAY